MNESGPVVRISNPSPHVLEIKLNRPEKLNALNGPVRQQLREAIRGLSTDKDVRVAVLTGEGRAFCVGADVAPRPRPADETPEDDRRIILEDSLEIFLDVWRAPVPVIAKVNGFCMGLGTILVNCCDIVLIAEDAVVGWPVLPLGGGMIAPTWVWNVGMHRAKEMSYQIGSRMTGAEAAQYGFANHAVPAAELDDRVTAMANNIARVSRDLLTLKKEALNQVYGRLGFEDAIKIGAAYDALAHTTRAVTETREMKSRDGLKATIAAWQSAEPRQSVPTS
jgi:enoyl-CoA hydratase